MGISCVIPAKNESGYLDQVLSEVLSLETISDIIIVEGGSNDETFIKALSIAKANPNRISVFKQHGSGKFDAVKLGAKYAREEFLIIWDADGTVPLASTERAITHSLKTGCPTIGDRFKGEMEPGSMRLLNRLGNWAFAIAWTPILLRKPVDLLCGTKILPTKIFQALPPLIERFDPYGDFTLLAATKFEGYSIDFIPVDYQARRYGSTNIKRWRGGLQLLLTTLLIYKWILVRKFKRG